MTRAVVAAIVMIAIPALAFSGGTKIMEKLSGRTKVPEPRLNMRFHYDKEDVKAYWNEFGEGIDKERKFLEVDLLFPFLYCGALAASLLMAWDWLGRPYNPAWVLTPLFITLLADLTENLVQLSQLKRYPGAEPQADWIQIASTATALKLSFLTTSWLLLFFLVGRLLWRTYRGA